MAQQLKTKKFNVLPGQLFCRFDDQDKFQTVTDTTDNGFTECQRKQLQSIGISPVSLHTFMKILKSNILEACKVQVDCLKGSESDSYDKNYIKQKVNDLVRLQQVMKEKSKTASYSEEIQILTLVSECTVQNILITLNILFELHMKSKVGEILAKPAPKKRKNYHH